MSSSQLARSLATLERLNRSLSRKPSVNTALAEPVALEFDRHDCKTTGSVAAELEVLQREFLADFVEARDAEVLAFEQIVAGAADQFADRREAEADHALAGPDREVQIGDRAIEQRAFVGGEHFRIVSRLFFADLVGELAELQALRLQHVANFDERRFAEVLAREQLLLAGAGEVAERHDAHLLQAIAAADREFEIGDRNAEHLAEAILAAAGVFVVVHVAGGVGILLRTAGPADGSGRRRGFGGSIGGLFRSAACLHTARRGSAACRRASETAPAARSYKIAGVAVVAVAIVFEREAEQCAGVAAIRSDGSLQQGDDFARIAAQCRDRCGTLIQDIRPFARRRPTAD